MLDLLSEITGGGRYDDLLPHSIQLHLYNVDCLCLGLEHLIYVKRAAGRSKDLEAVAELEAILEERKKLVHVGSSVVIEQDSPDDKRRRRQRHEQHWKCKIPLACQEIEKR